MVAPAHMDVEDAADRLLAALPEGDAAGRARFAELGFPTPRDEDWRFTPITVSYTHLTLPTKA